MKLRNIILSFLALGAVCSCNDMFEPAMENNRTEEAMYEESQYAHGLLMYGYTLLPYQTNSVTDVATDDAVTNDLNSTYLKMALGSWSASSDPMSQWDQRKSAIQYINLFLSKVNDVKWAPSSASKQQMFVDRLTGEALGLRALQYYYLLMAHGGYADDGVLYGVPLLTEPENASSNFNQPRATFADCIKQIFEDCDKALELLPLDYGDVSADQIPAKYKEIGAEIGGYNMVFGNRPRLLISGRIVEAIKAQVALLAASPAFRDQSGVTSEEAADLAANVLKRINGIDGMDPVGYMWYMNTKLLEPGSDEMPEVLWRDNRSKGNSLEGDNFPPSLFGKGRINPSQNLVDAFPMQNGLPITDPASGYDPKRPYDNRDPRLSEYIVYNEMKLKTDKDAQPIVTGIYSGSDDNLNQLNTSTRTGYYLKKTLRSDASPNPNLPLEMYRVPIRIRYTEIFLAYAEAANDAWGPTGTGSNGFSAYDVIKAIRQRAGITDGDKYLEECAGSKDKMTELIRNERRIELCFENKRFWDLRRWKMPLSEAVKGVQIDKNEQTGELTYKIITVEDRKYDDSYMWYGPIPRGEVLKWNKLLQNKGWK